jgi:pimeloyl-ACP methyl ester carboxylesterase
MRPLQLRRRDALPALAVAALLAAVTVLGAQRTAPPAAVAGGGDFAGLIEIGGGRRLFLQCRGQGGPTVVLIAGGLNTGGAWTVLPEEVAPPAVLPGVAAFTGVCTYDRPGTLLDAAPPDDWSRSDPVPQPRSMQDIVADLHALLRAAGVPGPYVLAGHSMGGAIVRLYASAYPEEVVGLVLVDAAHEDLFVRTRALLASPLWAEIERSYQSALDGYPELERVDLDAGLAQLRRARADAPVRHMPLAVLARGRAVVVPIPDFPSDAMERMWLALQADLATLVPDARFFVAGGSHHDIHQDQPAPVTEAIRQVVAGVRDSDTWDGLVSCCAN